MRRGITLVVVAALMGGGAAAQVDPNDEANKPAEIEPLAAGSLLLDLAAAGSRLVAVGERGHVLLSDDQGVTWRAGEERTDARHAHRRVLRRRRIRLGRRPRRNHPQHGRTAAKPGPARTSRRKRSSRCWTCGSPIA